MTGLASPRPGAQAEPAQVSAGGPGARGPVRVTLISHSYVAPINHEKLRALTASGQVRLQVIVPSRWSEGEMERTLVHDPGLARGYQSVGLKPALQRGGTLYALPLRRLAASIRSFAPDVIHVEEGPCALVTAEAALIARRLGKPLLLFSWENLDRRYPYPFGSLLKFILGRTSAAIAGSREAAGVLRSKGFRGPVEVLPQLGVDPERFSPGDGRPMRERLGLDGALVVGFVGRLVHDKGVQVLLDAFARLPDPSARLLIVGTGPDRAALLAQAARLGIDGRIVWLAALPHEEVVDCLRAMDLMVVPSITAARWKEQFGHVLIEAMACGVPVIGSDSGEIPNVIGAAGLTFPEGDAAALGEALVHLQAEPAGREELGRRGRERVLECFTHQVLADRTLEIYARLAGARVDAPVGAQVDPPVDASARAPVDASAGARLKEFYATSDIYLEHLVAHEEPDYFQDYLRLVEAEVPPGSRVLDVGCGTGFSTLVLSQAGFQAVGMDLSPKFLAAGPEPGPARAGSRVSLLAGDAARIPVADRSFDAVASYNTLEHLPDVAGVLAEVDRVLRPGGRLVLLGPNILSPFRPAMYLVHTLRGRRGLPTFYETPWECLRAMVANTAALAWKRVGPPPAFRYRTPVLDTWEWEDTDADCVYLANPVDLLRYFRARGWIIQRYQGEGIDGLRRVLARLAPDLAGGVAIVVRKPGAAPSLPSAAR